MHELSEYAKSGDFGSEGGARSGRPKNEGGPNGATQAAIKKHLKAAGYISRIAVQKDGKMLKFYVGKYFE